MARNASQLNLTRPKPARRKASSSHLHALFDDPAYAFRGRVSDRIILKPISALRVSEHHARIHDEAQLSLIMGSFDRFGVINPIIIDENGEILACQRSFVFERLCRKVP